MISAVSRTMAVLELLSNEPNGMTVSEAVMRLGCEKSVVSRILSTLEADGYVTQDETRDAYRLGLKTVGIGIRHIDQLGITDLCRPLLQETANKLGELVQLAIVQGDQIIYVAKGDGKQRIRMLSLVGRAAELHASSAARVWLASLPEDRAMALVLKQGFTRHTSHTITNVDKFRAELARVRKNGFSTIDEELFEGASTVAVPLRNRRNERVLGAVIVSGPTYRMSKSRMASMVPNLQRLADKLNDVGNIDVYFGSLEPDVVEEEKLKLA